MNPPLPISVDQSSWQDIPDNKNVACISLPSTIANIGEDKGYLLSHSVNLFPTQMYLKQFLY